MKIGILLAIFNLSENYSNSNDLLKMIDNGKDNSLITFFVTTDEISSALLLKLDFRRLTVLIISSEMISMIPILFEELPLT